MFISALLFSFVLPRNSASFGPLLEDGIHNFEHRKGDMPYVQLTQYEPWLEPNPDPKKMEAQYLVYLDWETMVEKGYPLAQQWDNEFGLFPEFHPVPAVFVDKITENKPNGLRVHTRNVYNDIHAKAMPMWVPKINTKPQK